MELTENIKNELKPLIVSVTRDPIVKRLVVITCVDNRSGVRAAQILKAVTGLPVTNMAGIGGVIFHKTFAFKFSTVDEADSFIDDINATIAAAADEGVMGTGYQGVLTADGKTFFRSKFFYAIISILVVIAAAVAANYLIKNTKTK